MESFCQPQTWLWTVTKRHELPIKYWNYFGTQIPTSPGLNLAATPYIWVFYTHEKTSLAYCFNFCELMFLSLMNVPKPELNQGESISYSSIWCQDDKRKQRLVNCGQFRLYICQYSVYTNVVNFYSFEGDLYNCGWFLYIWREFYTFVEIYTYEGPTHSPA